jgi:hypothetical protein
MTFCFSRLLVVFEGRTVAGLGRVTALTAFMLTCAAAASPQRCDPEWSSAFPEGDIEGAVYALTVFDADGPGPGQEILCAGFSGGSAGGIDCRNIAQWDGARWSPMGAGLGVADGVPVYALAVYDEDGDGPGLPALFAGGRFTTAGGQPAAFIARWDGQEWSAVGGGVSGTENPGVQSLQVIDEDGAGPKRPVLIAGGSFIEAGDVGANFIARWDGQAWSGLSSGLDRAALCLTVFDDDGPGPHIGALYAGGDFQFAGGKQVNRLARWNGQSWEKWESGITAPVTSLAVLDDDGPGPLRPALYVGGKFAEIGGQPFGHLGRWDGAGWSTVGGGLSSSVTALGVFDADSDGPLEPVLIASGPFGTAGGVKAKGIAAWDGVAWSELDGGITDHANDLETFDAPGGSRLYVGGSIHEAGPTRPEGIVSFGDGQWRGLDAGFDSSVTDLVVMDEDGDGPGEPVLFASGTFGSIGGVVAGGVARWDGQGWTGLNGGVAWQDGPVALGTWDSDGDGPAPPALYASGRYRDAQGVHKYGFARWNGSSWALITNLQFAADEMLQYDEDGDGPLPSALFLAGSFDGGIMRWDGKSLTEVGNGTNGDAYALATFDPDGTGPMDTLLIVGGNFTDAGGKAALRVATWDGSNWMAAGNGVNGAVFGLHAIDVDGPGLQQPRLYAAGGMSSGAAYWDGSQWLNVGIGGTGYALTGFDPDGGGPAQVDLYFAGPSLVRRERETWRAVAGGTNGQVLALAGYQDPGAPGEPSLFIGGDFTRAGDQSSGHIARLLCAPRGCAADCVADGELDFFDFACFVTLFNYGDPITDCDASGELDVFDFLCFVNAFEAGCP